MPIYPYFCKACEHTFEEIQMMDEAPLKKCPSCKKNKLVKTIGLPQVIVRFSPKCVGLLAEENTRQLIRKHGKEQANVILDEKVYGKGGRKLKLPKGAKAPSPDSGETVIPWFRSGEVEGTGPKSETPIDVSKIKDPVKYIRSGDKQ